MNHDVTLGALVRYILEHRKGDAFKYDDETQIVDGIERAAKCGTLLIACNDAGICGVIIPIVDHEKKTVFIEDVLTTESWALKYFVSEFRKRFVDYTLTAMRNNKYKQYNTPTLCNKLSKESK
jgi:hypothetical protein